MRTNPSRARSKTARSWKAIRFQFLEGVAIASYAVGANVAYIYLRGEFWQIAAFLDEKIAEMEKAGYLGENLFGKEYSLKIYTHLGAGAYICGEETALLESLEGKRGQPRVRPPFPPRLVCMASRPLSTMWKP